MVEKAVSVKTKNNCISKPRKNRILIIGDGHAKGCAADLLSSLNDTFEVIGTVIPGSRLEHITSLAHHEISHLRHNDFVVIWGGTNDISRNKSDAGLRHMRKFALQNKHTNIIAVTPSHRYDLLDFNKETVVFTRKLHKQLRMHHVSVMDTDLTRDKFTRHGLHLNSSGKEG